MNTKKTVVVGLSGGVDSAVAALLLKNQGYEVHGIFMQNWQPENDDPYCTAEQDLSDARAVCDLLKIPFEVVNFSKEYWERVFKRCLDEFSAGRTPNPDIWCNQEIKFRAFFDHVMNKGVDFFATGHYVRCKFNNESYQLQKGIDDNKDQSYFLYTLQQEQLQKTLFPVGELQKPQVREIAQKYGFLNAAKKDSTGICFIGERNFKNFLQEFLLNKPGNIITPDGQTVGRHDGLMYYTRGQRQGLGIGGTKQGSEQPWYVIEKDINKNTLIVGQGHDHPGLYATSLTCSDVNWISGVTPDLSRHYSAKIRYRQSDQPCKINIVGDDQYQITFDVAERAITTGQSVVFYDRDICLGGGIIQSYK